MLYKQEGNEYKHCYFVSQLLKQFKYFTFQRAHLEKTAFFYFSLLSRIVEFAGNFRVSSSGVKLNLVELCSHPERNRFLLLPPLPSATCNLFSSKPSPFINPTEFSPLPSPVTHLTRTCLPTSSLDSTGRHALPDRRYENRKIRVPEIINRLSNWPS